MYRFNVLNYTSHLLSTSALFAIVFGFIFSLFTVGLNAREHVVVFFVALSILYVLGIMAFLSLHALVFAIVLSRLCRQNPMYNLPQIKTQTHIAGLWTSFFFIVLGTLLCLIFFNFIIFYFTYLVWVFCN